MKGKFFIIQTALVYGIFQAGMPVCSAQQINFLSRREKKEGYQLLFNGRDLEGWHAYLKDSATTVWLVKDGTLMLDPSKGNRVDLITDKQFKNFDLQLEWKISHAGNSGILFNVCESSKFWDPFITGPEMQIFDDQAAPHMKKYYLSGSLYDLIGRSHNMVRPAGKWNKARIRVYHGNLTFWLNGKKVVKTRMWTPEWKRMVADSKFKQWPAFGTFHEGHIALQDHRSRVWFRNIKIRELDK